MSISSNAADPKPILVIDIGTSSVRTTLMRPDGVLFGETRTAFLPDTPFEGLVEFDAASLAETVVAMSRESISRVGPVSGIAIANQRCSTIVWDRATGHPVAPALGWQDLRTIGMCLELGASGFKFAPNQTATKAASIWDSVDPDRSRDLCIGTVDSWIAWTLSGGSAHVTEPTNAAITGLLKTDCTNWDPKVLEALRLPHHALPQVVNSVGTLANASILPGSPPIVAMLGDQQASLIGQGAVVPGMAKMTFGTGGMFDVCVGDAPASFARTQHGCFPIVCWADGRPPVWGFEGIMLTAGMAVDWLCDDLGVAETPADIDMLAGSVSDSAGVVFVPALLGTGTPNWDYGARGTLLGMTRGTTSAHIARAVLEGVACSARQIVQAAEADTEAAITSLRIDGGMSQSSVFVQMLADNLDVPIEVSNEVEATALGAGRLGSVQLDWSPNVESFASAENWRIVQPRSGPLEPAVWADAVDRAASWYPELSAIDF